MLFYTISCYFIVSYTHIYTHKKAIFAYICCTTYLDSFYFKYKLFYNNIIEREVNFMYQKLYVEVEILEKMEGTIVPQAIIYNDERYEIDRVLYHEERHDSKNVKGSGEMFIVKIGNTRRTIYREYLLGTRFRWFIETPIK